MSNCKYKVGDTPYYFDGRAFSFEKITILSLREDVEVYWFGDRRKRQTHKWYLYDSLDDVISAVEDEIDSLTFLFRILREKKEQKGD